MSILHFATYGDLKDMEQLETIVGDGEDLPRPKIPWPIIISFWSIEIVLIMDKIWRILKIKD